MPMVAKGAPNVRGPPGSGYENPVLPSKPWGSTALCIVTHCLHPKSLKMRIQQCTQPERRAQEFLSCHQTLLPAMARLVLVHTYLGSHGAQHGRCTYGWLSRYPINSTQKISTKRLWVMRYTQIHPIRNHLSNHVASRVVHPISYTKNGDGMALGL